MLTCKLLNPHMLPGKTGSSLFLQMRELQTQRGFSCTQGHTARDGLRLNHGWTSTLRQHSLRSPHVLFWTVLRLCIQGGHLHVPHPTERTLGPRKDGCCSGSCPRSLWEDTANHRQGWRGRCLRTGGTGLSHCSWALRAHGEKSTQVTDPCSRALSLFSAGLSSSRLAHQRSKSLLDIQGWASCGQRTVTYTASGSALWTPDP